MPEHEVFEVMFGGVGNISCSSPVRTDGANGGVRTRDLLITSQLLYHLSHVSMLSPSRRRETCSAWGKVMKAASVVPCYFYIIPHFESFRNIFVRKLLNLFGS